MLLRASHTAHTALCGAAPLARARLACGGAARPQQLRPVARKLCTSAPGAAAEAESGLAWLKREGQVDSGFWQGTALFASVCLGVAVASDAQRVAAIDFLLDGYRKCGLSEEMTDRKVIEDYVRKNAAAATNVIYASPTFYFLFAKMHGQSWAVSSVRVRRRPSRSRAVLTRLASDLSTNADPLCSRTSTRHTHHRCAAIRSV